MLISLLGQAWIASAESIPKLPQDAALAVARTATLTTPTLTGSTATGQVVNLLALRGQVVLVMAWSTDCAVCLNKMPELRANLSGWAGKGFQIVSVNTDLRAAPLAQWEAARSATLPATQQWPSLWAFAPGFETSLPLGIKALSAPRGSDTSPPGSPLPAIFVVDRQGKLRLHVTGRMPAEVWDTIAELL